MSKQYPAKSKELSSKVHKAFESMNVMPSPQAEVIDLESPPRQQSPRKKRNNPHEKLLEELLTPHTFRRIQALLDQKQLYLGVTDLSSFIETAITEWLDRNDY